MASFQIVQLLVATLGLSLSGASEVKTVGFVDLDRYLGTWYEIASIPQRFSKGCTATRADYSKLKNGRIRVLNTCRDQTLDGKIRKAKGEAKIKDKVTFSKLKVTFFKPFWADYWIIDLGANYEYAVVAGPSRKALFILSRTPQMDPSVFDGIISRASDQGFDIGKLKRTLQ